jgi:hypothetical protein
MTLLCVIMPLAAACASSSRGTSGAQPRNADGVFVEKGAVVLTGSALGDGHGSLLDTMRGKIPSFRLHRSAGNCPEISLRGQASFSGLVNPDVYVDGARTTDTCVLESLRAADAERVEVYPMGFTTRPGYRTHAEGLILVFMRQ